MLSTANETKEERDVYKRQELGVGSGVSSDKAASVPLLRIAAFFANAVDLKGMAGGHVTVLASDLLFDFSNLLREKFHRCAALRAHHVVVTAPVVLVLVARDAVMKGNFAGQATTGKQLQGPVDGGESDARVRLLDQSVQLVNQMCIRDREITLTQLPPTTRVMGASTMDERESPLKSDETSSPSSKPR